MVRLLCHRVSGSSLQATGISEKLLLGLDRETDHQYQRLGQETGHHGLGLGQENDHLYLGLGQETGHHYLGLGQETGHNYLGLGQETGHPYLGIGQETGHHFLGLCQETGHQYQRLGQETGHHCLGLGRETGHHYLGLGQETGHHCLVPVTEDEQAINEFSWGLRATYPIHESSSDLLLLKVQAEQVEDDHTPSPKQRRYLSNWDSVARWDRPRVFDKLALFLTNRFRHAKYIDIN